jgi:cell division protein ZapE
MNTGFRQGFKELEQTYPSLELSNSYLQLVSKLEVLLKNFNERKGFFKKFKSIPKGFYIFGNTGTGKTTIMNMFFQDLETSRKISIHFHDYLLDISKLLTKYNLDQLISKISKKIDVLCFDEFFIESIADAKLLKELFEGLITHGIVIILTSNFPPEKLYEGGFNREIVFPEFSNFLSSHLQVFHLTAKMDFREKNFEKDRITISKIPEIPNLKSETLEFNTYKLKCLTHNNVAVFKYEELFKKPRSINEFIFICRKFDKIYIKDFIGFTTENEDELIRFRNFIDIAYLRSVLVIIETKLSLKDIFSKKQLENIKIKRTYSRLLDMSSNLFQRATNIQKRQAHNKARDFFENL